MGYPLIEHLFRKLPDLWTTREGLGPLFWRVKWPPLKIPDTGKLPTLSEIKAKKCRNATKDDPEGGYFRSFLG